MGRSTAQREAIDLDAVVTSVLDDLEVRLQDSGAAVEVGALPSLWADPAQMRVLFQNLIANALKFHRPGIPPTVRVFAEPGDGLPPVHRIVVEDEGIGFEQEHAERIFNAFHRLHGRDEYEGSGVGLAICRRIAEHHGGRIQAEGRPGQGARFIVTLPADPQHGES